jgi:cytoskeletal protein RodZ
VALDTGRVTDLQVEANGGRGPAAHQSYAPSLQSGADIGQALKAIREFRKLSLEAVADTTRVRRAYLQAIEEMQLDKLPSRPFTIGYVRAYAEALGADGEAAVERFKAEEPVLDEPLRAPVGVNNDRDPRLMAIVLAGIVIIVAIVLWNVAQRAMSESAPPSPTAPEKAAAKALDAQKAGPVALGAPLPAPVESTTPAPYETPGLAEAGEDGVNHSAPAAIGAKPEGTPQVDVASLPATFEAGGRIYGAAPGQPSSVTLKALKSASLIVRGADGSVYFARQLAPGEAYRAPQLGGLTVETSEPDSIQVFAGRQSKGVLPSAKTALGALVD